jgi:hypothetical protein
VNFEGRGSKWLMLAWLQALQQPSRMSYVYLQDLRPCKGGSGAWLTLTITCVVDEKPHHPHPRIASG